MTSGNTRREKRGHPERSAATTLPRGKYASRRAVERTPRALVPFPSRCRVCEGIRSPCDRSESPFHELTDKTIRAYGEVDNEFTFPRHQNRPRPGGIVIGRNVEVKIANQGVARIDRFRVSCVTPARAPEYQRSQTIRNAGSSLAIAANPQRSHPERSAATTLPRGKCASRRAVERTPRALVPFPNRCRVCEGIRSPCDRSESQP